MKGTLKDCIAEIKASTGDLINDHQAEELLARVETRAKERIASGKLENVEQAMIEEAMRLGNQEQINALQAKKNTALNMVRKVKLHEFVSNYKNPGEGLWDFLVGGVHKRFGARRSVDYQGKFILTDHLASMYNDMASHKDGTLQLFTSGKMDREIAKELFELGSKDGKPGITGNLQARQAAEAVFKVENALVDRANLGGANIRKLQGYMARQAHDATAIRTAGGHVLPDEAYKAWRDFIVPKLDHEKTFFDADITDPEKFLRSTWEALSSGVRKAAPTETDAPQLQGFIGPGNLGKKMSESRSLHFKDADSWFEYNKVFGAKQLRESIEQGVEQSSRNIALLENLGPNYEQVFNTVRQELREKHRNDPKVLGRLDAKYANLDHALAEVDGSTRAPGNLDAARMAAGFRNLQSMAKLGGATLSSISDIPTSAAMLIRNGQNPFKAYHTLLGSLVRGRGDEEIKSIMRSVAAAFDGIIGENSVRYMSHDSIPGSMSRGLKTFFKLNLMEWWNDAIKTGAGRGLQALMADQAHLKFDDIRPGTRNQLELYGVTENRWNIFREMTSKSPGGIDHMLPGNIDKVPEEKLVQAMASENYGKPTKTNIQRFKNEVKTQLGTYFIDQVEIGVPVPGAAERALLLTRGTQPGTPEGEFMRFVMQFKGFPIAMSRKGVGMELYSRGAETLAQALKNGNGELQGFAHFIAATMGFGYMAMMAKDFFKGKVQRDVFLDNSWVPDPKFAMAAMAQGGGAGIYGDYLFGEYSRTGRSMLSSLAGPTLGQTDDLINIYTKARNGDDTAAAIFNSAKNNTPFLNLFYTRTAMDYLILYNLQETMNPGSLQRTERRMEHDQRQSFRIPPSSVVPRGGNLSDPAVGAREAINQLVGVNP